MSTQPSALFAVPSNRESASADLDAELARWLRLRSSLRASLGREASSLDGLAMGLRRVRGVLGAMDTNADEAFASVVSRSYRWAIRMARELQTIEQLGLDPTQEWARFEAFAPFALAFFDSALAAPFAATRSTPDVMRLRHEIEAVLAFFSVAMMSSAWAA
jgi:hypothetical protein